MRRRLLIVRRLEDIRNYNLIKALLKLRNYRQNRAANLTTANVTTAVTANVTTTIINKVSKTHKFGIVLIRTYFWHLLDFSKSSIHTTKATNEKLAQMAHRSAAKVLKRLKQRVKFHKVHYVSRLKALARLYVHMLYHDYKKKANRLISKAKIIARVKKDELNYNNGRKQKVFKYWRECFVSDRVSNRLKCGGSYRYFR